MMSIGKNWDAVIVTGFILIRIGYQNHKLAALERHISHNFFPNTQGQGVQGEVKKKHSEAGLMALNKRGGQLLFGLLARRTTLPEVMGGEKQKGCS